MVLTLVNALMVNIVLLHRTQLKQKSIHVPKDISVSQEYHMNKHVRLELTVDNSNAPVKVIVSIVTMDITVAKSVKRNWSESVRMASIAQVAKMTNPTSHHVLLVSAVIMV